MVLGAWCFSTVIPQGRSVVGPDWCLRQTGVWFRSVEE